MKRCREPNLSSAETKQEWGLQKRRTHSRREELKTSETQRGCGGDRTQAGVRQKLEGRGVVTEHDIDSGLYTYPGSSCSGRRCRNPANLSSHTHHPKKISIFHTSNNSTFILHLFFSSVHRCRASSLSIPNIERSRDQ